MSLLDAPVPPTIAGKSRVHRIEDDDEESPAGLRKRILDALAVKPLTRAQLCEELDVDDARMTSALGMMRTAGTIKPGHGRGNGYTIKTHEEEAVPKLEVVKPDAPVLLPGGGKKRGKYKRRPRTDPAQVTKNMTKGGAPAAASFAIDDLGRITIMGEGSEIHLSLPDTKRLAGFIDRSKALRT